MCAVRRAASTRSRESRTSDDDDAGPNEVARAHDLQRRALMMNRRGFLAASFAGAATLIARRASAAMLTHADVARPPLTVYKDAACGCCKKWVEHMQSSGFSVTAHD